MRKIATIKDNDYEVRTYRDHLTNPQYAVKAYENGILQTGSEYYTDDNRDAQNAALDILDGLLEAAGYTLLSRVQIARRYDNADLRQHRFNKHAEA